MVFSKELINERLGCLSQQSIELDERQKSYLAGYPALLALFKQLNFDKYEDVIVGAYAAYGWMPTILKRPPSKEQAHELREFIRSAMVSEKSVSLTDSISCLKSINNSVVGTSKFLHFCCPDVFPIWDSNIANVFGLRSYHHNRVQTYVDYVSAMREWCDDEYAFPASYVEVLVSNGVENSWTKIRKLEFALYLLGATAGKAIKG